MVELPVIISVSEVRAEAKKMYGGDRLILIRGR